MQEIGILQQKQTYLRQNIDPSMYEDFYEFCEKYVGSVDINSWNINQIQQIVNKFQKKVNEKANDGRKLAKYSYNDYQSKQADKKLQQGQYQEESQISEVQNSKFVKSSAVSLLDEVLQSQSNYSTVKTQSKGNTYNRSSMQNSSESVKNNSAVNFQQFDFWTSQMNSNTPKSTNQTRNKSSSQYRPAKINNSLNSSPIKQKNTYNINEYGNSYNNINNTNNIVYDSYSARNSIQHHRGNDLQLFDANLQTKNKKTSPYLKKQILKDNYNQTKGTIKLKQVQQIKTQQHPQGHVININKEKSQNVIVEVPFKQTVNCFKSTVRNQLADCSLNVFLDKHQIIQRKFLASDYAMYNIKIVPLGIQCKRNYQDFEKLRSTLGKFFPGTHLPYLEQLSWFSGTNTDYINNQKKMLQMFTRDLIRNKQFRNSRVMQDFLTLKDHKAIKRKFQKYEQMQPLKGLEQLCVLEGKVNCTISSQQKKYIDQLYKFINAMDSFYQRKQKLTQNLIQQYAQLMKTFQLLTSLTQQIQKKIKQFNTNNTINVIKYLGNAIKIMRQTYTQQYSHTKFLSQISSKKVLPFLKYQRNNFNQLHNLIQVERKLKKAFDKRSLAQKIGVGQTYMSQSAKGTKRGVIEESDSFIVLKHQVGYIGYQVTNQGQRIFDQFSIKIVEKWQQLSESYLNRLTDSITYWQKISKIDKTKFNTELTF